MSLEKKFYSLDRHTPLFLEGSVKSLKKKLKNVNTHELKNFLNEQNVYTLNKRAVYNFKRMPYLVSHKDILWEMDLLSILQLSKYNDDVKYLLTVIDVFSKEAFVRPLRSKYPHEVTKVFKDILKSNGRKCLTLRHDAGKEFFSVFSDFLKSQNIRQEIAVTTLKAKCAVVENFNKNLRKRIYRYLLVSGQNRYIDMLPRIVEAYNTSYHSSIMTSPSLVNSANTPQVYANLHRDYIKQKYQKPKFAAKDYVRIVNKKKIFDKPTFQNVWSNEIFRITKVKPFKTPKYEVEDLNNKIVKGTLYEPELQKVNISHADVPIKKIRRPTLFENDKKGQIYIENLIGEKLWRNIEELKSLHKNSTYNSIINSILN